MNIKRILLISLIAVAVVVSVSAVSAGWFDGLFGEQAQDNVIEIENITFNITNATKFELFKETEDEDGYCKWYMDENKTGYNVHIYNYSYVDDMTWNEFVQSYKDSRLVNLSSKTVDDIVVYETAADGGSNVGAQRFLSYVQNDDSKIIVELASSNPNETAKMTSTLKFN